MNHTITKKIVENQRNFHYGDVITFDVAPTDNKSVVFEEAEIIEDGYAEYELYHLQCNDRNGATQTATQQSDRNEDHAMQRAIIAQQTRNVAGMALYGLGALCVAPFLVLRGVALRFMAAQRAMQYEDDWQTPQRNGSAQQYYDMRGNQGNITVNNYYK